MGRRNDPVWSSGYDWLKGRDNFRMLRAKDASLTGAANNHYLSAFTKQKSHTKKLADLLEEHGFSAAQIKQHTDRMARMSLDKQKAKYQKVEAELTGKTRSIGAKIGDAIAKKGEAAGKKIGNLVPPPPPLADTNSQSTIRPPPHRTQQQNISLRDPRCDIGAAFLILLLHLISTYRTTHGGFSRCVRFLGIAGLLFCCQQP